MKKSELREFSTKELKRMLHESEHAKDSYDNRQGALKILLNSAYGALGSRFFRLYDTRQATAITYSGQAAIKWVTNDMNKYLQELMGDEKDRVVASDTDSIYIAMDDLVQKFCKSTDEGKIVNFLHKACEGKFHKLIDESYKRFANQTNAKENQMDMKRESIGNAIFVQKKKYIINVYDNEGVRYKEPELKIVGLEAIRSTTPEFCKDKIKECIWLMFHGTEQEIIDFIEKTRNAFYELEIGDIAMPIGLNDAEKYTGPEGEILKGAPYHVKGAIAHNKILVEKNLENKFKPLTNGEKVKVVYLKEPNPIGNNTIAFQSNLPSEFGLDKYIDRETQFDKVFINGIKRILDIVGWKTEETITLDDFFS